MTTVWIGIILSATAIGFVLGHLGKRRVRRIVYVGLLLAPTLVWKVALAFTPPALPSFIAWWFAGMVMISPAVVAWAVFTTAGFALARWSVR